MIEKLTASISLGIIDNTSFSKFNFSQEIKLPQHNPILLKEKAERD